MMLEPLGEVGANFSLQLSSRTQFTKINNKKVITENQCEKHKKSSLVVYRFYCMALFHSRTVTSYDKCSSTYLQVEFSFKKISVDCLINVIRNTLRTFVVHIHTH